tara:strand:+ start:2395 stop:3348 length:954 start_codon:yes stop_codon:yes gene_type:complete
MKIAIIGPGLMPIPPEGWGGVEHLVWDMKLALNELNHDVQIINTTNAYDIIGMINQYRPDFVHIQYDDWVVIYPYIQYPCAISTHFAYIENESMMGPYKQRVFDHFPNIKPNVFALSEGVNKVYEKHGLPKENLFLTPNGLDIKKYRFTEAPKYPDRSICIGKIEERKKQYFLQQINSLWFAGNIADSRFDTTKNYLGEIPKSRIFNELTDYGNLVLISDGEVHPRVCTEALAAGLGVVISECGIANLDLDREFITVIPDDRIRDIDFVQNEVIKNREYSLKNRQEIHDYSMKFDWKNVFDTYYFPSIEKIIGRYNG